MSNSSMPAEFESNMKYPGNDCCTLYKDDDYWNILSTWCLEGQETRTVDLNVVGGNDQVSSYWCGKNVWY